jgi:hypothetical protein
MTFLPSAGLFLDHYEMTPIRDFQKPVSFVSRERDEIRYKVMSSSDSAPLGDNEIHRERSRAVPARGRQEKNINKAIRIPKPSRAGSAPGMFFLVWTTRKYGSWCRSSAKPSRLGAGNVFSRVDDKKKTSRKYGSIANERSRAGSAFSSQQKIYDGRNTTRATDTVNADARQTHKNLVTVI